MKHRIFCILILLCLLLTACGKDTPSAELLYAQRGEAKREALGELLPAADADAVQAALRAAGQRGSARWQPEEPQPERLGPRLSLSTEGNTVVTDGTNLYMLDSYGLVTVSAAGSGSQVRAYTKVVRMGERWSERLYLWQDRIAILWSAAAYEEDGSWRGTTETWALVLSVADPAAPTQVGSLRMEGSLLEAHVIDGNLCVVTQKTLLMLPEDQQGEGLLPQLSENGESFALRAGDVYLCSDPTKPALTLVAAIGLDSGRFVDALAFTDGTEAVHVDGSAIYLARSCWKEGSAPPRRDGPYSVVDYTAEAQTEIKRLRLDGGLTLEDGCRLSGALSDPDGLRVGNGQICLASELDQRSFSVYTDEDHGWSNYEGKDHVTDSRLSILNAGLEPQGTLIKLGGEAGIQDCRFLQDSAWIAAGDTLSVADLSDPADPQIRGSFPVSGQALLLRDLGNGRVLSFALPVPGGKTQLTVYDISDLAKPKVLDSLEPESFPAQDLTAKGALFVDEASGLIGWAAAGETGIEYRLACWTEGKLKDKGAFALEYFPENARALLLNGLLYLCSPGQIYVADPQTMQLVATVSNAVG